MRFNPVLELGLSSSKVRDLPAVVFGFYYATPVSFWICSPPAAEVMQLAVWLLPPKRLSSIVHKVFCERCVSHFDAIVATQKCAMSSLAAAAAAVAKNAAADGIDIFAAAKASAAECRLDYQDLSEIAYKGGLSNGQLPEGVRQRTSLLALGLPRAGLAALPAVSHLRLLATLDVSGNFLSAIATSISELQRLEIIDCSDNKLSELPSSLFTLTKLKQLIAYKNSITALVEDVNRLVQLQELNLCAHDDPPSF